MRRANENDRGVILEYLKNGLKDCVYLYIDILNYGISLENMTVWVDECREGEGYSLVVMKYYDSFQIYSHELCRDMMPVSELLDQYPVAMISGRKDLIEELAKLRRDYRATYGSVYVMNNAHKPRKSVDIVSATEDDAEEIAALICSDRELGGHYTVHGLAAQLRERMRTGTGRSYIIRENGEIVAHNATYAEAEGIAVVSGTIVAPKCRNKFYFLPLCAHMRQQLEAEGKTAYAFSVSKDMIERHMTTHTKCGEYGKLTKAEQQN